MMTSTFTQYKTIFWVRRLFYGWLLLQTLFLLPEASYFFGPEAVTPTYGWSGWDLSIFLNLFQHPWVQSNYAWFIGFHLLFLVLGFIGKWPKITALLIYFTSVNLLNRLSYHGTGGEVLIKILLFYLIFADEKEKQVPTVWDHVRNHLVLKVAQWNVVLVYVLATIYKLEDPLWMDGSAMYWIAQIDAFSNPMMKAMMQYSWLYIPATYLGLFYQAFFPIAVWIKKIKVPWLLFGICFHLLIAFGMGVFSFGIIMIISYRLFIAPSDLKTLWGKT